MTFNGLLRSRKFWLSVFGILQALVLHYLAVPDDVWQAIAALVGVLIASIAIEDAGTNLGVARMTEPLDLPMGLFSAPRDEPATSGTAGKPQ